MSAIIRIAVDAMSGDLGPRVAISAAQKFLSLFPDTEIILVGNKSALNLSSSISPRLSLRHADDVVTMDDDPLTALRHKKNSSMWQALALLRDENVDACVSAGNTGALLAMSKFLIKTFPSIDRPAICKSMPVAKGVSYLLDLGANISVEPKLLHEFALMGAALARAGGLESPKVALLNIGTEAYKGTEVLQQAQILIAQDASLEYVGFVEADAIFKGDVDVIVCDGFHGNIALKASEGLARFIAQKVSGEFKSRWYGRLMALLSWPILRRLAAQLDPALYNGASFLGLQKTVVKSHGSANERAFMQALIVAREQVVQAVPERIQHQFTRS